MAFSRKIKINFAEKKSIIPIGILLLCVGYYLVHLHITRSIRHNITAEISKLSPFINISYEKLRVNILTQKISLRSILIRPTGTDDTIQIDDLTFQNSKLHSIVPTKLNVEAKGLSLNPNSPFISSFCPYLNGIGYNEFKADIALDYAFKKKEREFRINNLSINAAGMGKMEFVLFLANVDFDQILANADNPGNFIAAVAGISIAGAKLNYEDFSLAKRLTSPDMSGKTGEINNFVSISSKKLEDEISTMENKFYRQVLISILNFIKRPEKINIIAAPLQPVPLSRFIFTKSMSDIIDLLYIRIEPVNNQR